MNAPNQGVTSKIKPFLRKFYANEKKLSTFPLKAFLVVWSHLGMIQGPPDYESLKSIFSVTFSCC